MNNWNNPNFFTKDLNLYSINFKSNPQKKNFFICKEKRL